MNINKDRFITNVTINNDEIKDIRLLQGKKKTLSQWYAETKADIIINGALYESDGIPIESYMTGGKVLSSSTWCKKGFGINWDKTVQFGEVNPHYKDFTSAFPLLIENCKKNINFIPKGLEGKNPRTVFSKTDNGIMLTVIDGRQEEKPGMAIDELADYMYSLGVIHSANLDGGGSTHLMIDGKTVNSPSENRSVSNIVAVWLKNKDKECDKMKIGVNIGHYGTIGAEGILSEIKCCTDINGYLVPYLKAAGHEVIECNDATYPDYVSATKLANKYNLDLVISLHCNSATSGKANGTEVLYYTGNEKTKKVAATLSEAISNAIGTQNRGAKARGDLYILNCTKAPAVLIECFFVSNRDDCSKYNPKKIASAIAGCFGYAEKESKNKYSYDDTVEHMIVDGVTTVDNMVYWEKVLDGREPLNKDYVRAALDRYHDKLR